MTDSDPVETAWRIHAAIMDWTGKVDSKASITLALESAVVVAAFSFSDSGQFFAQRRGWENYLYLGGLAFLGVAIILVGSVVMPMLRSRQAAEEAPEDFIFFGHAMHWDAEDLADKLREVDMVPVLSRQIVRASQLAWRKHRRLQLSLLCALPGAGCLAWSAALIA